MRADIARVVVLWEQPDGTQKVLQVRRGEHERHNPGKYELPGGEQEFGETIVETALRELAEETGIVAEADALEYNDVFDCRSFEVHFYVLRIGAEPQVGDSDEHDHWLWSSLPFQEENRDMVTPLTANYLSGRTFHSNPAQLAAGE